MPTHGHHFGPWEPEGVLHEIRTCQCGLSECRTRAIDAEVPDPLPVRSEDPETSQDAAASVLPGLAQSQQAVYLVLEAIGPSTAEELVSAYREASSLAYVGDVPPQRDSGIRTRVVELRRLGQVVDTGERRETSSGRSAIVWKVA